MGFEIFFLLSVAHGYDLHGKTWAWQDLPGEDGFELNVQSFENNTPAEVGAAWSLALDIWNAEGGAPIYLPNHGTTDNTTVGGGDDGHNVTQWLPSASAYSSSLASSVYNSLGDDLTDCDIKFYGSNTYGALTWSTDPDGAPDGAYDLTHTAVHELGHCIGFSHSDVDAIMASSNGSGTGWERRHLHDDDIAGLHAMYGQGQLDLVEDLLTLVDEDGDGLGQPGEILLIELSLRNDGTAPAVDILGILSSTDASIVLDETAAELGDLPPGSATGTQTDLLQFSLTVAADCAGASVATAEVQITDWDGDALVVPVNIDLDCPSVGTDGPPADGWEDAQGGCACDHSGSAPWGTVALLLPLFLRRRTG